MVGLLVALKSAIIISRYFLSISGVQPANAMSAEADSNTRARNSECGGWVTDSWACWAGWACCVYRYATLQTQYPDNKKASVAKSSECVNRSVGSR